MRQGVRLGIDVGSVRVGVARSDPSGLLATPVETVRRGKGDLRRIREIADEHEAIEVVVGLPTSLSGREGPAAAAARSFAERLAVRLAPIPVRLVDERFTTVTAQQSLRASGVRAKKQRGVVDQAAAVVLLQTALDGERATGFPPGRLVPPSTSDSQEEDDTSAGNGGRGSGRRRRGGKR
ncbi:Holliday junction resolvase RuvX [Thermostaphylospora chromogena]|uniref:Putative pre-16S rRNA nuclease n=1 Tax=Thermostaphylospora chromogena TaxID=35622 RepID=A0A1H1HMW6_9ACTN|nr:Holliday junction resolvase RuvX [Thermostaphylospora chromogena]SDR26781.1 putative holliday junction resolvase [Thermostaphylospora chromogena]